MRASTRAPISSAYAMEEAVQRFSSKWEHIIKSGMRLVTRERILYVTLLALVLSLFYTLVLSLSGMFHHSLFPVLGFSPPATNFYYQPPPHQPAVFP